MKICKIPAFENTEAIAFYIPDGNCSWKNFEGKNEENWKILADILGITLSDITRPTQTHTSAVKTVIKNNGGEGIILKETESGFDGVITNERELLLCTLEADCVPVYLFDPVQKAAAMLHSGWKGTAGKISANAVKLMTEKYGTKVCDIIAATGPCICPQCYEVSADLIQHFEEKFTKEEISRFFTAKENGKYLLNLPLAIKISLENTGVKNENIYASEVCTYHSGICPSYRKGNIEERILTGIMIR